MLIVALVLAVIGLAALVTAVVTSNELIAWVCIAASLIGVLLLIVDAVRERSRGRAAAADEKQADAEPEYYEDYPDDTPASDEPRHVDESSEADAETTVVEQADSGEERR
ncbi:hypothetical protein [Mycolicibacterium celeriflavum]|uniref:Uncharacterized protein n=1 Tax=Mycolicibacterium celeriflavum TaxID=1249101 RepID=A0A1X0C0I1_MYCCF|nr:hypothetical protein [Mycolicibacterium celeriflavum]MCV7237732.1 DUF308 domain-containing protein [Mycolicibacterium celeriflavum]ORA49999.1 hypothetical protein BST21_05600 [Mycolicibacterium celeriflavum]BBY42158.1 hypothetical protein MCEL_04530 [Mycolicibacterium celeriflavum]